MVSDYIRIHTQTGPIYGGNQNLFPDRKLSGFGCGLIVAADVSLYLQGRTSFRRLADYVEYVREIERDFFYLPRLGMNGIMLALGMNRVCRRQNLPYRAHWHLLPMGQADLQVMRSMLRQQIPVILAIGPNFPHILGQEKVKLYQKKRQGQLAVASNVQKHFLTITEITEDGWMKVSSWGKIYYLSWEEVLTYARKKSMPFFTNYLQIRSI